MSLYTHEAIYRYEIEAELAQACPRRVAVPGRTVSLAGAALCLYIVAATIVGALAYRSTQMLWLGRFGHLQNARIALFEPDYPAERDPGAGALFPDAFAAAPANAIRAEYAFSANGKAYQGWTIMADRQYKAALALTPAIARSSEARLSRAANPSRTAADLPLPVGVPLRSGRWLGHFIYRPVSAIPPIADSAILAAFAGIALIAGLVGAAAGLRRLLRAYFLVRHGDALVATLREKEATPGEVSRYTVTYGFIALNGQILSVRESCTPEQWRSVHIGDAVTVLHLPSPSGGLNAALYRNMLLQCAPAEPAQARTPA